MSMHLTLMGNASRGLPRQGLVALYDPYCDADGLDATARAALQTGVDYSGNGNTLTYGANTNASTDDPSNTGTAWSFDGGDYLGLPNIVVTSDKTVLMVARSPSSLSGVTGTLISSSSNDCRVMLESSRWKYIVLVGGSSKLAQSQVLSVDTDYAIIGRCKTDVINISVAGTTTPGTISGAPNAPVQLKFLAQYRSVDPNFYTGAIYLVAVWNRYLTDSEISRAYRCTKSLMASRGVTLA
jgi:hypothetical protein